MRNRKIIVILSGEIASGKSVIREGLKELYGFEVLNTREALEEKFKLENNGKEPARKQLQVLGRKLDRANDGAWVLDHYQSKINMSDDNNGQHRFIIDCARLQGQIDAFRHAYGLTVYHIHTNAPKEIRLERYISRKKSIDGLRRDEDGIDKFEKASADPTEKQVSKLGIKADLVIDTSDSEEIDDYVLRAASFLRILPKIHNRNVDVVIGGQFGSEGKGQIAGYLAKDYDCLIRVGGPNAGHKVYSQPQPDVFHIIPSGANRNRDAQLVIGPGAVIREDVILGEIQKYNIDPERLLIDSNATIITLKHQKIEAQLNDRIGSTTQGVGAATADNLFISRLKADASNKAKNLNSLKSYIGSAHALYQKMNLEEKKILLEGTQGTFLSLHHGFYPYVTSRDTTAMGCLSESGLGTNNVRKIIMVVRRYPIRVQSPREGTSGTFMSKEIDLEEVANRSGYPLKDLQRIERTTTTNKERRIAEFSWRLFRKACELNTPTDIAFTFSDYITYENQKARRYGQLSKETTQFVDELERCAEVPVSLIATRFSYRSIIDRRNWI